MIWNSTSVESTLATIAAALFAVAGVVNLARLGAVKRDFARWRYPVWFPFLCGALELISAVLLVAHQTRPLGLMLAGAVMVGALVTLLRNREPFAHVAPALVFFVLIVITGAVRLL